jgi:hypothetical protein
MLLAVMEPSSYSHRLISEIGRERNGGGVVTTLSPSHWTVVARAPEDAPTSVHLLTPHLLDPEHGDSYQ